MEKLRADDDPTVSFSRLFERVKPDGDDAGASSILSAPGEAVARFRKGLRGYVVTSGPRKIDFGLTPTGKVVRFTIADPRGSVLAEREFHARDPGRNEEPRHHEVIVELPRANAYRVDIRGDFVLRVPPETPFVFEASVAHPAWISYSGPHYFYVPQGTKELIVDANPRLSLQVPGEQKRRDIHPADRKPGAQYAIIQVPEGADGRVWHTTNMTRGQVSLLNVPPLLSFHRDTILIPREVSEADGLTTK